MNKKIEKGLATRQAIVDGAMRLFAVKGFAATSVEAVLDECEISRGALYHHFTSKEALFEAVFEALENQIVHKLMAGAGGVGDPEDALRRGCEAWLDMAHDPVVRQIAFVDAPSVLGWQKWRAIEARYGFGLLKAGLVVANAKGVIPEQFIDTFSNVLLASLNEVAMMISRSPDPVAATKTGKAAVAYLLTKILTPGAVDNRPA